MRWFSSDHHIGHRNIINLARRPHADLDEMHADLARRWNSVVSPNDDVYYLGDLTLGSVKVGLEWFAALNGRKRMFVLGNHDRGWNTRKPPYDAYFEVFEQVVIDPVGLSVWGEPTWLLSHLPPSGDSRDGEDRYADRRPLDHAGRVILHGHCHGRWRKRGHWIDVGVDAWGGYPVSDVHILRLIHLSDAARLDALPWTPVA